MSEKIFLTRNQLAKFLPTPEAIKAFENLFKIARQQTPNNIDEVQISAESALSMANYSLSVLDNVSKLIEALELQPPAVSITNERECLEIIKEPDWNFIKNHPTTIAGYGITDAYTQVVADAPLTGYGTTSSHLSIPAATALVNGYLSSTDWTTFNSKQTAYTNLTNIGSLANSSGWLKNNGSGTFSYSTPTKSDVGLGNVTNNAQVKAITSTTNKLVKFSDTSSTITNSVIYDDGANIGISVAPSAWSGSKAFDIGSTVAVSEVASYQTNILNNAYYNSGYKYKTSDDIRAAGYVQSAGNHYWYTAPSGTAGNAITFTQAMKLDPSGDLTVPHTYSNTTASAANMFVDSAGKFYRSTSARKYKTNIEDVEKQYVDSFFNNARPVYYKSLSENDNPNWGYWGFIAEEIAEFDPRLVHWRYSLTKQELVSEAVKEVTEEKTIDAVLDDEGNEIEDARVETVIVTPAQEAQYKEVPDTDSPLEAEGVMYERIVVMLTAKIQELQARIEALEMTKQS